MLSAAASPFPTAPASPAAWPNYLRSLSLCFLVLLFSLRLINRRVDEARFLAWIFFFFLVAVPFFLLSFLFAFKLF